MGTSLTVANNILHYALDTGLTVTDTSGNSNTGILQGTGTTSVTGQISTALSFNGSGAITFTSVSQLGLASPASAFSTCFWVKTTQTDSNILTIRGSSGGGLGLFMVGLGQIAGGNTGTGFPFCVTQGDNGSGFGTFGGTSTTVSASDGNWHHIACTRTTGQTITIYLDGVVLATVGDSLSGAGVTPVLANSAIGFDPISNTGYLNGLLDDFQIYNRALTSTEVNSIYTAGLSALGQTYQLNATFAGAGSLTSTLALRGKLAAASFAGVGVLTAAMSLPSNRTSLASTYAGSGALTVDITAVPSSLPADNSSVVSTDDGSGAFVSPTQPLPKRVDRYSAPTGTGPVSWIPDQQYPQQFFALPTYDRHVRRAGDDYVDLIVQLHPTGQAWPSWDPTSFYIIWINGVAQIWGDVDGRADDLLVREADPRLTSELLPDWERAFGLPDDCLAEPLTIGNRQQALVTRVTMQGGQSRQFFQNLAFQVGQQIEVIEHSPFTCGLSQCGDTSYLTDSGWPRWELGDPIMRFYWTIAPAKPRLTWFRCGSVSELGKDPFLQIGLYTDTECLFNRLKPAHTALAWDLTRQLAILSPTQGA